MIEFTDECIRDVRVTKPWDSAKDVDLVIDLPRPPHRTWSSLPEVQHVCLWGLTGKTQGFGGHTYHQVVGRWGPFIETRYAALEPRPPRGQEPPKITGNAWAYHVEPEVTWRIPEPDAVADFTDGTVRSLWRGLHSDLSDLDLGDERYVGIGYSPNGMGNICHTRIDAVYLERLLARFNIDWIVTPNPYRKYEAEIEPRVRKPQETYRNIYNNAHNRLTVGGTLGWKIDDHGRREELWFGAYWPSEAELRKAMDDFVKAAQANPPRTITETRKLLDSYGIFNEKGLKARYPDFQIPESPAAAVG